MAGVGRRVAHGACSLPRIFFNSACGGRFKIDFRQVVRAVAVWHSAGTALSGDRGISHTSVLVCASLFFVLQVYKREAACSGLRDILEKTRTHVDKERAPMAASVTLPPPGPAREFYCRVSPGRPPPDTPTDRAHRKNPARRTALTPARPCSLVATPLSPRLPRLPPRTRAPASLRDYELHQLGSNQRPKRPRPERCTN